jgi:cytochrome d ubiquinol oxidase subunit I
MLFGDAQGRLMEKQQPMKMAAAEAIYNTERGAGFSIFATGDFTRNPGHLNRNITIPHGLSLIAELSWNGTVKGINQINAAEQRKYGPGDYVPIVGVTYWTFRLMIGAGVLMLLLTVAGLVLVRRRSIDRARWFQRAAVAGIFLPILANWTGWIFTEMGRQPWVVFGLLSTNRANSPNVASSDIVLTLTGYIVLYGILIAIGGWLMVREIRHGAEPDPPEGEAETPAPAPSAHPELVLAY